jgi:hypothetical protein
MAAPVGSGESRRADASPGWPALCRALVLYAVCLAMATYPVIRNLTRGLPRELADPLMHLWVMRWYKAALLSGRMPLFCPDLQYPAGAPLGYFSPMHFQSLLYFALSAFISNDALIYNILWTIGFLLNGVGTYILAWWVLRDRSCAWFAGLFSMLSGTMTLHAIGHLELLYVGWFPLFLVAWIRFIDRPSRGRLAAAVLLFLAITMGAAYFMAQTVIPAACYLAWKVASAGRTQWRTVLRERLLWLVGFGLLVTPPLLILFSSQIWAVAHGHSMARPQSHFQTYVAPLWTYVIPTSFHALGKLLPFDVYLHAGEAWKMTESTSYLGIVALALLHYAAIQRVRFERARFLWSLFVLMVVLALGASWTIGTTKITLPAGWLRAYLTIFRLTRYPARFNMFATVCAAVLAAAGLRHLLARVPSRTGRGAILVVLAAITVADLSVDLYSGARIPELPAAYAWLLRRDPHPTLLEIPVQNSGSGSKVTSSCGYWQSIHGGATSAGYSGVDNLRFDNIVYHQCPFTVAQLVDPAFLTQPDAMPHGIAEPSSFDDSIWLYTKYYRFSHIVLHESPGAFPGTPECLARLKGRLEGARIYDDGRIAIYETARLKVPSQPTLLCADGWRQHRPWEPPKTWHGRPVAALDRKATVVIANPDPTTDLVLRYEGAAFRKARSVQLLANGHVVARWTVASAELATYRSPRFRLGAGIHELQLVSDGQSPVVRRREEPAEADTRPYSLRVTQISVTTAGSAEIAESSSRVHR